MKKIVVACDTVCDLPKEFKEKYDIKFLSVPIMLDGKEHFNLTNDEIFNFVKRTGELPKTAAPSFEYYKSFLLPLAKENDYVIFFSMSSGISSAYNICSILEKQLDNLTIIDSKNLSGGIALQVIECLKEIDAGLPADEIAANAKSRVEKVASSFVINTLNYLHKGGRCSTLSLLGANLLKIKPQIVMDNGVMVLAKKFRGKLEAVIEDYLNAEFSNNNDINLNQIIIAYTTVYEELHKKIAQKLKSLGFDKVYFVLASSTIASHCGENTFGFFYYKGHQK